MKNDFKNGTIYFGDVLECAKKIESNSVDCVITSPPYWQLRDYGFAGQWGLEPTYKEYLAHLQELMTELWRIVKPQGTVWINLGDTYASTNKSSGGASLSSTLATKPTAKKTTFLREQESRKIESEIQDKCLMLIPHRFAIDCIDNGWILRNDVIWAKPNGMPESVTDRFSKKHEFMFFFVKQQKYYFDLDSVRSPTKHFRKAGKKYSSDEANDFLRGKHRLSQVTEYNPLGKNCGDVADFWEIPTKPSASEHYASYNLDLIKKPILAGCPINGVIYDPFIGTGTTAIAAIQHSRKFIGSEGNLDYFNISKKSITNFEAQENLF